MTDAIRARDVAASQGPVWLVGGWRLVRAQPLVWAGLTAGWLLVTLTLLLVPFVGGIASNVLQPVFFASFALAAAKQLQGGRLEMADLLSGFRRPLKPLVNIGAILLVGELAIFALLAYLGLPGFAAGSEGDVSLAEFANSLRGREWILLVGLVLTAVVKGALWFAPALLAFHDLSTPHAIRWSVYAALSNLGAMVLYGVALVLLTAMAILPWGLGLIVSVPVMAASSFAGYWDVFGPRPEPEPAGT